MISSLLINILPLQFGDFSFKLAAERPQYFPDVRIGRLQGEPKTPFCLLSEISRVI